MGSVADLTCLGRLHTHPLLFCLLSQWRHRHNSLAARVLLDQVVLADLPWWLSQDNTRSGIPLRLPKPTVTLMTDASLDRWSVSLSVAADHLSVIREWPPSYTGRSINSLKLDAVLLALHEISGHRQVVLLILWDNTMTVSYLTKEGGTHLALLSGLAWQIFQLAWSLPLEIQVCHILGKRNIITDSLSRWSGLWPTLCSRP